MKRAIYNSKQEVAKNLKEPSPIFSGSLVALITPMTADLQIDYSALEQLIDWHIAEGSDGLVILGTTGESPTLTGDEREQIIKHTVKQAKGKLPIMVGTGSNSTAQSVLWTQQAEQLGADAALVVLPYYNRPSEAGITAHFARIAEQTTLPIYLYNVPKRTSSDISNQAIIDSFAAGHITGVKDATGDLSRLQTIRQACGDKIILLSGDDETANQFIQQGGNGVITVAGNLVPHQLHQLCQLAINGNHAEADKLADQLAPLFEVLGCQSNPIPIKWALSQRHAYVCADGIRLPLTQLEATYHAQVEHAMQLTRS